MNALPKIWVALPAMDELDWLPECFFCLKNQVWKNFELVVCINQPDHWWDTAEKKTICINNQKSLEFIEETIWNFAIHSIDRSSPGKGWDKKNHGVGIARKTLMDYISSKADDNDIIVSMDADTRFAEDYFQSIVHKISKEPDTTALCIPYKHELSGNIAEDKAMLRYEIYMRYYLLQLIRIQSPYAFTALGSAMAYPIWAYRAIGGMSPKKSGEDFYLLQKLTKFGPVKAWNKSWVYPGTRFSDRVFFGTGPAMIKGNTGNWDSYPIYAMELFENIRISLESFPDLYENDIDFPIKGWIFERLGKGFFSQLKENARSKEVFVKACHDRFDGLRTLQYLKEKQDETNISELEILNEYGKAFCFPLYEFLEKENLKKGKLFDLKIELLEKIRFLLLQQETEKRKKHDILIG